MLTFWRHGYETTSIVNLTTAMGVTAPSLYTAFGDKKQLFLEAVRLYAGDLSALENAIACAPSSREAARDLLVGSAERFTGDETPKGCLLASATATGSSEAVDVQHVVAEIRARIGSFLKARIMRDIKDGALPLETQADGLCGLVMATIQGLSVLARDGADRAHLLAIVEAALGAWPERREP